MPGRRIATLAIALLFSAAEVFAFVPQLHVCVGAAGRPAAAGEATGPALAAGTAHSPAAAEDCSACRLAGLAMTVQSAIPIAVPLPRAARAPRPAAIALSSPRLDRASGRAPPLA